MHTDYLTVEKMPDLHNPSKVLLIRILQLIVIIFIAFILWLYSNHVWYGAIIGQSIIIIIAISIYTYITKKSELIRKKYLEKFTHLAYQNFYYRYLFIAQTLNLISFYFPLFLYSYDFIPQIIKLPNHWLTEPIMPYYISIPLGLLFIILGLLIRKPSGGFNFDTASYVYLIFPDNSKQVKDGLYKYIRHPRYLGRFIEILGFGLIANTGVAICVSLVHIIPYLWLIQIEEKELIKRFRESYKKYQKSVPVLFPSIRNLREFFSILFRK